MTEAIVGAIATIFSAVITLLITTYLERMKYFSTDKALKEAVRGKWKGTFSQMLNDENLTVPIDFNLSVSRSGAVTGKAEFIVRQKLMIMDIKGGFYSRNFLKLNYANHDKSILQFGSFVFKLSDDAANLTGHFVGYGHISGKVIAGPAIIDKN